MGSTWSHWLSEFGHFDTILRLVSKDAVLNQVQHDVH